MLPIQVDKSSETPVYIQIALAIRELVDRRVLQPGDRLPTTRELALQLDVNRTTVVSAYREMRSSGLADATVGRGTFVVGNPAAASARTATAPETASGPRVTWQPTFSRAIQSASWYAAREVELGLDQPDIVDFAALAPDETLFPVDTLRPIFDQLLEERGRELLQYGGSQGDVSLRAFIADDLRRSGIAAETDDIVIVNGIQQGIDLTLRILIDPGDVVLVESPTYTSMLTSLGLYRAEVADANMTPLGIDVELVERVVERQRPKLIYTMPNFQNPTGVTMDLEHRRELIRIASAHGVPILEDDYEKELRFAGEPLPSLKALDASGLVLHMGTFSKVLFPGLRLGWIAAPPAMVEKLNLAKRAADLHTSSLTQAVVAEFCAGGHYRHHLEKLQRIYRQRQETILGALERSFPPAVQWTRPAGGFVVWITLPEHLDSESVLSEARAGGVIATPGTLYFARNRGQNQIRLSFARTEPSSIERGVRVLAAAIRTRLEQGFHDSTLRQRRRTLPQL
jgi:DNA-binding transcriptional MocR family regulator